jgi:hypothetical protein
MRVFLLDLWLDLREKRLALPALLLLAGIIAVVLIVPKGQQPPPPTPTATTAALAPTTPVIQSQPQAGPTESKLQTFSPRDPFEATKVVVTSTSTTTTPSSSTTGSSTGTSTGTSTTPSSGSTGGGSTTGSGPTSTGNTGTGTTGTTTPQTKTTLFTYTVDLRFGEGGNVKPYTDVKRLDLIPSSDNPKIVFLGVTTSGKTAVFLVDSNIGVDTAGGKCRPSADQCTFLYLRPDDSHSQAQLTDSDGTVYHLRLLAIHRVSVSSSNGSTGSGSGSSGSGSKGGRSHAFTGSAGSSSADSNTVPGDGSTAPGEPNHQSSFQQFFADGGK